MGGTNSYDDDDAPRNMTDWFVVDVDAQFTLTPDMFIIHCTTGNKIRTLTTIHDKTIPKSVTKKRFGYLDWIF